MLLPKGWIKIGCPPLSLKLVLLRWVVLLFISRQGMGRTIDVFAIEDQVLVLAMAK